MAVMINAINNSVGNDFTVKSVTNDGASEVIQFNKSRAGGVITSGDSLGGIFFAGYDGSNNIVAARITSTSSGTIAAGRVAGNLVFSTHPDSVSAALTRLTINPTGAITIATPDSGTALTISGGGLNVTGTTVLNTPLGISSGGTNASSMTNTYGVNYFDGTSIVTTAVGTATHVLTSNGPGVAPTFQAVAAGGATTFNTDSGAATVAAGAISILGTANEVTTSGAGSTVTISLPNIYIDADDVYMGVGAGSGNPGFNVFIGPSVGNSCAAGQGNVAMGYQAYDVGNANNNTCIGNSAGGALTSGIHSVFVGQGAGQTTTTGARNIAIGSLITGTDYPGKGWGTGDSDNICIANQGVSGDSGVIRIGTSGTHTKFFASPIYNTAVGATTNAVIVDSSGQLGGVASLTVPNGGTGAASFTAYSVICAGTTSTGAFQNVSGLGTAGQVLTSQGAGALPAWGNASVLFAYTSVNNAASPYTVLSTDYYLSVDASGGVVTIRLPNAPTNYTTYIIKDRGGNAATNNITVTTVGGAVTIDGGTSFVMNTAYESITVLFNGTSYEVF